MAPKVQQVISYDLNANLDDDSNNIDKDSCLKKKINENSESSNKNLSLPRSTSNLSLTSAQTSASCTDISIRSHQNHSHQATSIILNALTNSISNVMSPAMAAVMIATPIAVSYPLLQLLMLFTIAIGTSPLYYVMLTFLGNGDKCDSYLTPYSSSTLHRRQPSIVGSIRDTTITKSKQISITNNNNNIE